MHIYAVSHDRYWLDSLESIKIHGASLEGLHCPAELVECLDHLPDNQVDGVILLDASGYVDIKPIVQMLRDKGWRHVIVVTADMSAKKAISILRRNLAYDYWGKTYDLLPVQRRIEHSLQEIQKESKKLRPNTNKPRLAGHEFRDKKS